MNKKYHKIVAKKKGKELDLLYYEIEMLNGTDINLGRDKFLVNNRLESFLIHSRNLIDFLSGNSLNATDLISESFKNKDNQEIKPVELLKTEKRLIHKKVAHLTIERIQLKEKKWDLLHIRAEINKHLEKFIESLSPKYFPTYKGAEKEDLKKLLKL